MEGLVGRRAGLVRAKASREPPREGWRWAGDWRRSGGLSSLAVAAVSRDTMRSFSPPAATFLVVSVTARLLLAVLASHGRGARSERCLGDFEGAAVRKTCSDGGFPSGTRPEDPASAREARQTAPSRPIPRPVSAPEAGQRPAGNGPNGVRAICGQSRGFEGARTEPDKHPGQ